MDFADCTKGHKKWGEAKHDILFISAVMLCAAVLVLVQYDRNSCKWGTTEKKSSYCSAQGLSTKKNMNQWHNSVLYHQNIYFFLTIFIWIKFEWNLCKCRKNRNILHGFQS